MAARNGPMNKQQTKHSILEKSAALIYAGGFNNTGIQQILDSAGVPKGSFYFYFDSKETLGLEVVDYFTEVVDTLFVKYLLDASVPPLARLENLFGFYERNFKKTGYRLGCPIGNLSLEMSDINDKFREKLRSSIDRLVSRIESCLSEAQRQGELPAGTNVRECASFIFYGFEGALLHMKVVKGPQPMTSFRNFILDYLKVQAAKGRRQPRPERTLV
jgi:TetR/AcrR family transcriptional regulator, transcriptional repressor for nem operon